MRGTQAHHRPGPTCLHAESEGMNGVGGAPLFTAAMRACHTDDESTLIDRFIRTDTQKDTRSHFFSDTHVKHTID